MRRCEAPVEERNAETTTLVSRTRVEIPMFVILAYQEMLSYLLHGSKGLEANASRDHRLTEINPSKGFLVEVSWRSEWLCHVPFLDETIRVFESTGIEHHTTVEH
jgi:hypothetical protein